MNTDQYIRSRMLLGDNTLQQIHNSKIALFGVGGVGGHCADALARAGVGEIHLFDNDTIALSNLNRQLVALHSTIGRLKVDVMKERILDINPQCKVVATPLFYTPKSAHQVDLSHFDYVIDCIDTVTAKIELVVKCTEGGIPLISSMGSANKFDPSAFVVTDISKTEGCPLARVMRKELRDRGILRLKVVFSNETAKKPLPSFVDESVKRQTPGSLPFVPATAGLLLASAVVRDLGGY
ncbi:MAG: tRNA threonylcarbamoyladenosine dehydratase [Eubacteriales bacterium]